MRIFQFIRRYFVFLSFLILQALALWMLFQYNRFHHAAFLGVATEVTGSLNTQVDKVDDYFHLREENRRVHRMNDSLMNLLPVNFNKTDTTQRLVTDSLRMDTVRQARRYLWREAKVVFNSVTAEKNYLQLNRGTKEGIRSNMAVLNSDGSLVGLVVNASANFSQVMSLLHTQSRVQAALKNTNTTGTVEWDGKDPRYMLLRGISRDVAVKKGDSVMTSMYSYNFPPNYLIGRIDSIRTDRASGFYLLRVRTATNFNAVQQVFVVENLQRAEQEQLEEETRRMIEQQKK
ncbi:MAG TPA: rod shape-determining protein MreC [Chitinophagaceae bacterium]|jgi:rod shape-determining protein MreC|nr:rod shape-determining protein MreC [Chitinophagaceae bacterium]